MYSQKFSNLRLTSLTQRFLAGLSLWLLIGSKVHAALSGPSTLVYGAVVLNGTVITAQNTHVYVEARHSLTSPVIASYSMGEDSNAGDYYLLRLPMDEIAPASDPGRAVVGDNVLLLLRDSTGVRDQITVQITAKGSAIRGDFGVPNSGFLRHPADNNPADNILSINEVTAYGYAWQAGLPWSVAPTNIPIDYVTRAALLWKGGEKYKQDLAISSMAPLWWVNDHTGQSHLSGRVILSSVNNVIRHLPSVFVPGQPIEVRIDVVPSPSVSAYAVEDVPPQNWDASVADGAGTFSPTTGTVRWGPFFDNQPRTLTYTVYPTEAVDRLVFDGVASFDGISNAIEGSEDLWRAGVEPRLTSILVGSNGKLGIQTHGLPRQFYSVEVSADLQHWTEIGRGQASNQGEWHFEVPVKGTESVQFYRSRPVGGQ